MLSRSMRVSAMGGFPIILTTAPPASYMTILSRTGSIMRANRTIAFAPQIVAMLAALIGGTAPLGAQAEDVPASVDTTIIVGGESSIVLNPANSANLVVGSNDNERHGCNVSR